MPDPLTPEQRRRCMQSIKGRDTKPELLVRRYLHARGFRFRLHVNRLPGRPDIVLPRFRTVIFVNGCFWHGHEGCRYYVLPKSNVAYWKGKIEVNRARDLKERVELRNLGWHVITIWECQLKPKLRQETLSQIADTLQHTFLHDHMLQPKTYEPTEPPSHLQVAEPTDTPSSVK